MAYKASLSDDTRVCVFQGELVHHFWAIRKTVGWGCHNKPDDVRLVQYLINVWAKDKVLKMDGIFGNKTYKAIKSFQKWTDGYYECDALTNDGKVSAADGNDLTTGSDTFYTIHLLNYTYLSQRRIYYNDIRMDRELPPELCAVLSSKS